MQKTHVKLPSKGENSINPCSNKAEMPSIDTHARAGIEKHLRMN